MLKEWHNTICTDWDGVWEIYPHSDPYNPQPVPDVHDGIQRLLDAGWFVEIYSGGSKHPERLAQMKRNLLDWFGQAFWDAYVETGQINFATGKPTAKIYLDDRGMTFHGWNRVTPEVLEGFRAWWQINHQK